MRSRVFISHEKDDRKIATELCAHLEAREVGCWIAPRDVPEGTLFADAIVEAIESSGLMVVLLSRAGLESKYVREEVRVGFEAGLILLPVLLEQIKLPKSLRLYLGMRQFLDLSQKGADAGFDAIHQLILERLKEKDTKNPQDPNPRRPRFVDLPLFSISPALVVRSTDLREMNDAWEQETKNVLTVHAWGGCGKSSLIGYWLGQMAAEGYRGADAVFGYSFEGTAGDRFIETALQKFGDPTPTSGTPEDKGKRLAAIVGGQRSLLVLDGFQAVQEHVREIGRIASPAVRELITALTHKNNGLCVIGSRLAVRDIEYLKGTTAPILELKNFSPEEGAKLLKTLGVTGPLEELKQASAEVDGHALTLSLLGSYLKEIEGGNVLNRNDIKFIQEDVEKDGHAERMLQAYEQHLEKNHPPALSLMRVASLLIGPVESGAVRRLVAWPPIPGLTDDLVRLDPSQQKREISHLRKHGLLAPAQSGSDPFVLETRPLVREFFACRLEERQPDAFRAGHERLYSFYRDTMTKSPTSTAQMTKAYYAVCHACIAKRFNDALTRVYWPSIKRNAVSFNTRILGAFAADLFVLKYFFSHQWRQLHEEVSSDFHARLFYETAFDLRAIGRLEESLESMRHAFATHLRHREWRPAAEAAGDVCLSHAILGQLAFARKRALRACIYADRSHSCFERVRARSNLVCALVAMGRVNDAERVFGEAERLCDEFQRQKSSDGPEPTLGSYWFYQLLLELGAYEKLERLIDQTIPTRAALTGMPKLSAALADTALAWVSLKQAGAYELPREAPGRPGVEAHLKRAGELLASALENMTDAAMMHHRPRVLLARAAWHRLMTEWEESAECLEEVNSIAERGGMRLFRIDHCLESARLQIAKGERGNVSRLLGWARDEIAETGYFRRQHELEVLERA